MEKCLNREACNAESKSSELTCETSEQCAQAGDRLKHEEVLYNFTSELDTDRGSSTDCKLSPELENKYWDLLCHEARILCLCVSNLQLLKGYTGVLCGSCASNYGQTANFRCTKCWHPGWHVSLLLCAAAFIAGLVAITIKGNHVSSSRLVSAVMSGKFCNRAANKLGSKTGIVGDSVDDKKKKADVDFDSASQSSHETILAVVDEEEDDIDKLKQAQLAKWRVCEIIKVWSCLY